MKKFIALAVVLLALVLTLAIVLERREKPEVKSQLSDEIVLMRTNGGWLEVSTVRATESFSKAFDYEILWIDVGQTASRIRVPAHYTYRARLAEEWKLLRRDDQLIVVVPNVEPKLPVAVELNRMEKESSGIWSVFTGTAALDDLERSITAKLAKKAHSKFYINLQRETARKTVAEFVQKWLLTQTEFQDLDALRLRVLFRDEPLESLGPMNSQLFEPPLAGSQE